MLLNAREAMRTKAPDERYLNLSRIMLDVSVQKKCEPLRTTSAEAALRDLVLESVHSWLRREPQLAPAMNSMITDFEAQRAALGDGRDRFEEEVAALFQPLAVGAVPRSWGLPAGFGVSKFLAAATRR